MTAVEIESRTINGIVCLSAADVAAALRNRAGEIDAVVRQMYEEPVTPAGRETAIAYAAASLELRQRADWVDIATIEHVSSETANGMMDTVTQQSAWLVLLDRGGLFAAHLDEQRARRAAEDVDGILVGPLPVAADYRPTPEDEAQ